MMMESHNNEEEEGKGTFMINSKPFHRDPSPHSRFSSFRKRLSLLLLLG